MVESAIPRDMYRIIVNKPKNFKFKPDWEVFRKGGKFPNRRLTILGYQGDKIWLNDLSYEEEKNLVLAVNDDD